VVGRLRVSVLEVRERLASKQPVQLLSYVISELRLVEVGGRCGRQTLVRKRSNLALQRSEIHRLESLHLPHEPRVTTSADGGTLLPVSAGRPSPVTPPDSPEVAAFRKKARGEPLTDAERALLANATRKPLPGVTFTQEQVSALLAARERDEV
jgi:hypothetical protein